MPLAPLAAQMSFTRASARTPESTPIHVYVHTHAHALIYYTGTGSSCAALVSESSGRRACREVARMTARE